MSDEELRQYCVQQIIMANSGSLPMATDALIDEAQKLFSYIRPGPQLGRPSPDVFPARAMRP